MFCQACGNEIAEGARFCSKCGATQDGGQVVRAQAPVDERAVLIQNITDSSEVINAIAETENKITQSKEEMERHKKGTGFGGILAAVLVGLWLSSMFSLMIGAAFNNSGVVGFIAFIVAFVGIVAFAVRRRKNHVQKLAEFTQIYNESVQTLETLRQDASLSWLPYDYRDSFSMGHIVTYLQNMRARNIQEAINLLETEMHQARVEFLSASAASAAQDAAASAGASAAFSFLSLFK